MESKANSIVEAIRGALEGIVSDDGVTYWYTPARVVRHHDFDESCLDASLDTIYVIIPEDESGGPQSSCGPVYDYRSILMLCHRFEAATLNPFEAAEPILGTVQDRMLKDVEKKLTPTPTVPIIGAAYGVEDILFERKDRAPFVAEWAIAAMQINTRYSYTYGQP